MDTPPLPPPGIPGKPVFNNIFQASLIIPVQVYNASHVVKPSSKAMNSLMASLKPSDIVDFHPTDILKRVINPSKKPIFYIFNPSQYKPSENVADLKKARKALQIDLRDHSRRSGFTFKSHSTKHWGGQSHPDHYKFFQFGCNNKHIKTIDMMALENNEYKLACTNGERLIHSRYHGNKGKKRKTSTSKPTTKEEACTCEDISIYNNDYCFFMRAPNIIRYHTNHTPTPYKDAILGSSILPNHIEHDRRTMAFATSSSTSHAIGLSQMHSFSTTKMAMANAKKKDLVSSSSSLTRRDLSQINSSEGVRKVLLEYHCKVLVLTMKQQWNSAYMNTAKVCYDISNLDNSNITTCGEIPQDDTTIKQATEWVNSEKTDTSKAGKDLLCIAWTSMDMMKLALAFPQSLSIDATHKTVSIDNLTLLTATVRDSFGKTTVCLRMWIPNQKKWMFRYIMLVVIPKLYGTTFCSNVKSIVTDGDPHLVEIIDLALTKVFLNAVRKPCAWHIVERPLSTKYRAHFTTINTKKVSKYFLEWFCRFLQRWLYSWMRPSGGIYNEEEYRLSKAILFSFLESDAIKSRFTEHGIKNVKEYVLSVTAREHKYLSIYYLDVNDNEVYSNSAHEATNHAIKHCSDPVKPNMSLGTSTDTLCRHDKQVFTERWEECLKHQKTPLWTRQWSKLTTKSASIISNEQEKTHMVIASSWVESEKTFYIVRPNDIHRHSSLFLQKRKESIQKITTSQKQKRENENRRVEIEKKIKRLNDPTLKELGKLKYNDLLEMMSADERPSVDIFDDSQETMQIPEFTSVFKVKLLCKPGDSESWYLSCSCKFGKRYGAPCVDEFFVYNQYLKHCGVKEWNHTQVNVCHLGLYSYLQAADEKILTHDQRTQLSKFKNMISVERFGTLCEYDGSNEYLQSLNHQPPSLSSQITGSHQELHSSMKDGLCMAISAVSCAHDKRDTKGRTALEWNCLPVQERVTNYKKEFVTSCMENFEGADCLSLNESQFETEYSQPDGFEDFGRVYNSCWTGNTNENKNDEEVDNEFSKRMKRTSILDCQSRQSRKADLMKEFYELLGSSDLRNESNYISILSGIRGMKNEIKKNNEKMTSPKGTETVFPNSNNGDRCVDMITKRKMIFLP